MIKNLICYFVNLFSYIALSKSPLNGKFNSGHMVAIITTIILTCVFFFAIYNLKTESFDIILAHLNNEHAIYNTNVPNNLNTKELDTLNWNISSSSPLDQFNIRELISIVILDNIKISLTNIGLYLTLSSIIIITLYLVTDNYAKTVSNEWSAGQESLYATIYNIVISQINDKRGQMYFPFMFVLFLFILCNNLIGMVPYSFASTSHFVFSFSLSFTIVIGATILGFIFHNLKFFSIFVPENCPLNMLVLLVLIEFISYIARNISLGLRLAANILSGHMLLSILSGFTYNIMNSGVLYFFMALLPLAFIIAFAGLELGIAFIQAQVFVVLSCSYIKDGLELH